MSASFLCEKCGSPYNNVLDSRQTPDSTVRIRRHQCQKCKHEFVTEQYVVSQRNMKRAMVRRRLLNQIVDIIDEYRDLDGNGYPSNNGKRKRP